MQRFVLTTDRSRSVERKLIGYNAQSTVTRKYQCRLHLKNKQTRKKRKKGGWGGRGWGGGGGG